ncbi:LutC/YkgG family protein [Azospirillum halopraeferens]|uniref:LutC/YkgG family protein n=1 Tax=Azospirillum halopraeferens TaxID=34010 RepID=UPI000406CF71|nr:LUD domain-containing protein [Azospirillum halopraeferens]
MSGSRERILGGLRRRLGQPGGDDARRDAVERRLADHPRNPVPARALVPEPERVALFVAMATEAAATVERLPDTAAVADAVADLLASRNLPAAVRTAPDPLLAAVPWHTRPALTVSRGPAGDDDPVSVTGAFAGIAETGTLMLVSGPEHPTTLNFLPDTHIVVLPRRRIVATYEDAWDLLRRRSDAGGSWIPRTVNLVTGPSRTGDIEQTIQLGAHGPRSLHILLVEDADTASAAG